MISYDPSRFFIHSGHIHKGLSPHEIINSYGLDTVYKFDPKIIRKLPTNIPIRYTPFLNLFFS